MSELILNSAPAPELRTAVSGTAETLARPGPRAPLDRDTPANPFAALLSGFLQGTQPPPQAAGPEGPASSPAPAPDERSDSGADLVALLALPGSATALPAVPTTSTDAGSLSGKTLPVSGNPLPAALAVPIDSAGGSGAPDTDATPVAGPALASEERPRISLADLALSRPLEAAPGTQPAVDGGTPDPTALALAGRSLLLRGARTSESLSPTQPLSVTQGLVQSVANLPVTIAADELALRLTTAGSLPGTLIPSAGAELAAGQLAAFAASNDGGNGSPGAAPLTGPGGPDTASATLLGRLGNTTLPALQPLGNNQSFAGGLADRLLTLGGPGAHTARLKLHPEDLGELNVEIQIDDGSAQVWFGTTTSQARDAIEASLPRLRELFADQGLALTRTHVDGGSGQMGHQNSDSQRRMATGRPSEADFPWRTAARGESSPLAGLLPNPRPSTRLVDAWA